jgi:hypothetical protein
MFQAEAEDREGDAKGALKDTEGVWKDAEVT